MARKARIGRCRSCRRNLLQGLDEDLGAFQVSVDPKAVSLAGEAVAAILGLGTYMLRNSKLYRRDPWQVAGGDPMFGTIVVEHRCGMVELLTPFRTGDAIRRRREPESATPPF